MRAFLETWKEAAAEEVILPQTSDPDYTSLATLLRHVLNSSRGYLAWMCEKLELPEVTDIERKADIFLEHLLEIWRLPLRDVPQERFFDNVYTSRWGVAYCIEAMLEHAVMHPIRHEFQLRNLLEAGKKR
jgi:hypothetical protein